MNEIRIPLDPCNPGQFFACCGLLELIGTGSEGISAHFEADWHQPRRAAFVLSNASAARIDKILQELKNIKNYQIISRSENGIARDEKASPLRVQVLNRTLQIDWWLDIFNENTSTLANKLWPGRATTETIVASLLSKFPETPSVKDLFTSGAAYLTGRFGIDPRSSWDAQDLGYSPHAQSQPVLTFPIVEILGAIGLQGFRPVQISPTRFSYRAWAVSLPLCVARVASAKLWNGLSGLAFSFAKEARSSRSSRIGFAVLEQ